MFINHKKLILSLIFPITILVSFVFLLSSCNSLEFNAHSQKVDDYESSTVECHESTFTTTARNNTQLGFILVLMMSGFFANSVISLSLLLKRTQKLSSLTEGSPPRLFNLYTLLFSRGILNSKSF